MRDLKKSVSGFWKQIMPKEERVQQQSGGWAMTGQMPVPSEGMDAIQNLKTMAGSPDADTATIVVASVSQSCAWSLRSGVHAFVNP
jgi:hypothetical protein